MEENKFKAKRVDNGEWVVGSLVKYNYSGGEVCDIITGAGEMRYQVIPETVCQYIGRKDINGEELYENDIVGTGINKGTIYYNAGRTQYRIRFSEGHTGKLTIEQTGEVYVEKLGNKDVKGR